MSNWTKLSTFSTSYLTLDTTNLWICHKDILSILAPHWWHLSNALVVVTVKGVWSIRPKNDTKIHYVFPPARVQHPDKSWVLWEHCIGTFVHLCLLDVDKRYTTMNPGPFKLCISPKARSSMPRWNWNAAPWQRMKAPPQIEDASTQIHS